jgi:hypothetical protein
MVKQLNVFSENRPGKLAQITGVLADANVSVNAVKISSVEKYGILKFLVDDPEKGFRAFKQAGVTVSLKDVLAVEVTDKPGSLHHMLSILGKENLDVEDCYGFVVENEKRAIVVLELYDFAVAKRILEQHKYRLIGSSELYNL